jgi:protein SCO1
VISSTLLAAALAVMPDLSSPDTAGGMHQAAIGAGIEERLGETVDFSLAFLDEHGNRVTLGDYFSPGRPVLLNFSYFHCPMLCGLVQDGMARSLRALDWMPGADYEILTVSMDWREGPAEAQPVKERILPVLEKPGAEAGWHFLTGDYKAVRALAASVGFRYNFVPGQNDFAHGAGLIFLSPAGVVSRYLYGVEFSPRDTRLALLDAAEGRSLSFGEKFAMLCFKYDPDAQGYVLFARNFMKAGGLLVLGLLLVLLIPLWRREIRGSRSPAAPPTGKEA